MEIEFDSIKDVINREKHGLALAFCARIFDDPDLLILQTLQQEDEEERYKAIGWLKVNFIPLCMSGADKRSGSFR